MIVANRLTSPAPLVHVEDWARAFAVPEVFGVDADALNDDRVGRALDAIASHLDEIVSSIGARAIGEFGIDVSRLHWDMTSISLVGDYNSPEAGFVSPSYGKPKDRRVDRKQVQTGLAVSGDGAIPVFHRAYDGKAGEVNQIVAAMESLKKMAGKKKFLLIGDSKLVSYTNLTAIDKADTTFVAPASKSYVSADVLAACDKQRATPVAYVPERHTARTLPAEPPVYLVYEDTTAIAGPRKTDPALSVRRVFVWSSGNAQAAVTNRNRKCERATGDLDKVTGGLGGRYYKTEAQVRAKVEAISRDRRVGLPAFRDRHREQQADAGLAFRPGRHRCRSRHRRLVRPAHQPGRRRRRHRRSPPDLQRPPGRRTPLRQLQRTTRRLPDDVAQQPAHPSVDQRDLPRVADLLPRRTGRTTNGAPPQPDESVWW